MVPGPDHAQRGAVAIQDFDLGRDRLKQRAGQRDEMQADPGGQSERARRSGQRCHPSGETSRRWSALRYCRVRHQLDPGAVWEVTLSGTVRPKRPGSYMASALAAGAPHTPAARTRATYRTT